MKFADFVLPIFQLPSASVLAALPAGIVFVVYGALPGMAGEAQDDLWAQYNRYYVRANQAARKLDSLETVKNYNYALSTLKRIPPSERQVKQYSLMLSLLGSLYKSNGQLDIAAVYFKGIVDLEQRSKFGSSDRRELALRQLADVYRRQGMTAKAEQVLAETKVVRRAIVREQADRDRQQADRVRQSYEETKRRLTDHIQDCNKRYGESSVEKFYAKEELAKFYAMRDKPGMAVMLYTELLQYAENPRHHHISPGESKGFSYRRIMHTRYYFPRSNGKFDQSLAVVPMAVLSDLYRLQGNEMEAAAMRERASALFDRILSTTPDAFFTTKFAVWFERNRKMHFNALALQKLSANSQ